MLGFIHLRTHSSYSLLEGAIPIAKLAKLAEGDQMPALGIADTNNLFGALEFADKMVGAGIQPIIGISLSINFGDEAKDAPSLVLIAQNEAGYMNLMTLSSLAFLLDTPHVTLSQLSDHADGLFVLTGSSLSFNAEKRLLTLKNIFNDALFIELQRHGLFEEQRLEPTLLGLALTHNIALIATNQPYFAAKADHESHDALIAIAEGAVVSNGNRRQISHEHYFKTRKEMIELFKDVPEALENTVILAQKCSYWPVKRSPILPRFAKGDEAEELRAQAFAGLLNRLKINGMAPNLTREDYEARLDFELKVIEKMQFPGYFLIVSDFIKYAKSQMIPVGPGRGSGAGSLVAYSLTITDLDPLRFALLFERFLNPDRVSMPDFDIDFCQERRDEVIQYVRLKYGNEQVAQIITFGSLQARGVLRDVGRVLEMPYSQVDKLCKLVPQNPTNPVTLTKAIETEPKLQSEARENPIVAHLFAIATKLEGLNRHASTHAAGLVIGDRPLSQLVPLYRDPKSDMPVTQFNMKQVENAGLVKFDFLGLKTLTVLQRAVDLLKRRDIHVDLSTLPLDDEKTFALLSRGETVGVFQVESVGMRKALVEMKASTFEDIIALVALYRPGPMANIPVYCNRKLGLEEPDYLYEGLEIVLKETYGIIVYQEQVMQIAQIMAGYSLGEADLLRRAMGKKDKVEMAKQKIRFEEGAALNKVPKKKAGEIFDLLEKFADYGFNKSHAAAYALVSYQTAFMKANHPVEFMAASCDYEMSNTDKLAEFRREALRMGIDVQPPLINTAFAKFEVEENRIHYALGAVKGVGESAAESLVKARGDVPFASLTDFAARLEGRTVNRKTLESLAAAGAFDLLEPNRAAVVASIDGMLKEASLRADDAMSGQVDIFGNAQSGFQVAKAESWSPSKRLDEELKAVGFFLSGHPLDDYTGAMEKLMIKPWVKFAESVKNGATSGRLAGSVLARQERRTKTGNKMGIITLSDTTGQYEAVVFSEGLAEFRDLLEPGQAVMLSVNADLRGEEVSVRINQVESLDKVAAKFQKGLQVEVSSEAALHELHAKLKPIFMAKATSKNDREIKIIMKIDEKTNAEMYLPGFFSLNPQFSSIIRGINGVVQVRDL
jgi:DNA polymerase III subunit alpha